MNRRKILKSLGAAGTAAVGISSVGAAEQTSVPEEKIPDIREIDGEEYKELLSTVMSDSHVEKIKPVLQEGGWSVDTSNGIYLHVDPPEFDPYRSAVIPLEKSSSVDDEQRLLIWIEKEHAIRADVPHVTGQQAVKVDPTVTTRSGLGWKVTGYLVNESGEISKSTEEDGLSNKVGTNYHAGPPDSGGSGGCGCAVKGKKCGLNYLCAAGLATSTVGVFFGCSACYASSGTFTTACYSCVNSLIGAGISLASCAGNMESCETVYRCADDTELAGTDKCV